MRLKTTVIAALLFVATAAFADDIVTMPTANQLKKGEVDAGIYYLALDMPTGAPQYVQYQTIYLGLTNKIELDIHHARVDVDDDSLVLVGQYKLLSENQTNPDVVVGIRNFTRDATTKNPAVRDKSRDMSFYACAAKTFFLNPKAPGAPLVRWHMGMGTPDWTLLGEKRHEGVFGGLQFLFTPTVGAVAQHDGTNWITGITIMPSKSGITVKGGTYGKHLWAGLSYRKQL